MFFILSLSSGVKSPSRAILLIEDNNTDSLGMGIQEVFRKSSSSVLIFVNGSWHNEVGVLLYRPWRGGAPILCVELLRLTACIRTCEVLRL
jgi:hypothetical protein